ncbi:MAG: hypothetical protein LBE12_00680 [Planctomycetaceae bacterium]|nr:hypothetical protein [Planctomycetaceae bacterium]
MGCLLSRLALYLGITKLRTRSVIPVKVGLCSGKSSLVPSIVGVILFIELD